MQPFFDSHDPLSFTDPFADAVDPQPTSHALTVSELNDYLKHLIDQQHPLRHLALQGELSNFTHHQKTGHFYFTLKDEACSIKAVMFRPRASQVKFAPQNGMRLLLSGSIQVFRRDGALQFYCDTMQPDGVGALALAFEQLKQRLEREGLFAAEHKRPLPPFPTRIGVVTAKTGAALHDIVTTLERRYPLVSVVLFPVLVQGVDAPASLCRAIAATRNYSLDLLIVGRGGGSTEDLWAFNDESVARAIYHAPVPVISAVGHEVDFTIADFVADLRAPTPTAAAELATPDLRQLHAVLKQSHARMERAMLLSHQSASDLLQSWSRRLHRASPAEKIQRAETLIETCHRRLDAAIEHGFAQKLADYVKKVAILEALNPLKVLHRGYSVTYVKGHVLTSLDQLPIGTTLTTLLPDGSIESTVTTVNVHPNAPRKE